MIIRVNAVAFLTALMLALQGCNGSTNSTPSPAISNISGDYKGTVQDSAAGSATVTGTLAQHGASAGGNMAMMFGTGTQNASLLLVIDTSNSVSGTIVEDLPGGTVCTFSTSGSYSTSNNQITGSYTAVTNCGGQTGTYTLTQQCFDTVTSIARRTMGITKC